MELDDPVKLGMRLNAIEYFLCKAFMGLALVQTGSVDAAKSAVNKLAQRADHQMFPGLDPAMSDLASAEWTDAIRRLIKIQLDFLEQSERSAG
jgi:hypothetical protein